MKTILRSQSGMSLLLPIVVIGLIIFTFMSSIAKMYVTLNENNQRLVRGVAAIQVMQDFAVLLLQANDLYISSAGVCPAGTTTVGIDPATPGQGYCWQTVPPTATCIRHPMQNQLANRTLCLDPAGTGDANFALNIGPPEESTFFAQLKEKSYELLKTVLNVSATEAVAQMAGRDIELPDSAGAPVTGVTTVLSCSVADAAGSQLCKRCVGTTAVGNTNVICKRIRVCLTGGGGVCNAANNDNWVLERIGILTRSN